MTTATVAKPQTTSDRSMPASASARRRALARAPAPPAASGTPTRSARSPSGRISPVGTDEVMQWPARARRSRRREHAGGPPSRWQRHQASHRACTSVSTHSVSTLPSLATTAPRARLSAWAAAARDRRARHRRGGDRPGPRRDRRPGRRTPPRTPSCRHVGPSPWRGSPTATPSGTRSPKQPRTASRNVS